MSWQEELSKGIRTAEQLAEYMGWDQEKLEACRQIAERYGGSFAAAAEDGTYRVDALIPLP